MATAWTLSAQDIITDALQITEVLGAGEVASADDYAVGLTALQNILKELPLHGVSWPKITVTPTALVWSSGTPAQVAMPADYFGVPVVSHTVNSANVDLAVMTKVEYDALTEPGKVSTYPQAIYIAPNNIGYLWPVPSANPGLSITYQAIAVDATLAAQPDVMQAWLGGLGLWVAFEISPKFGVDLQKRADIANRFIAKRRMMLSYAAESAPIRFAVAD